MGPRQRQIIAMVAASECGVTVADISQRYGITHSAAYAAANKLADQNLVTIRPPEDRGWKAPARECVVLATDTIRGWLAPGRRQHYCWRCWGWRCLVGRPGHVVAYPPVLWEHLTPGWSWIGARIHTCLCINS